MNISVLLTRVQKQNFKKLTQLKEKKIDNSTLTGREFNIILSIMNINTRQNINKKIEDFINTIN